jgi:hypothetical protein
MRQKKKQCVFKRGGGRAFGEVLRRRLITIILVLCPLFVSPFSLSKVGGGIVISEVLRLPTATFNAAFFL